MRKIINEKILIQSTTVVFGEDPSRRADILLEDNRISKISGPYTLDHIGCKIVEGKNRYLIPGIITIVKNEVEENDFQLKSENAVINGITSSLILTPSSTNIEVEECFRKATGNLFTNFSFFMDGSSSQAELVRCDPKNRAGIFINSETVKNFEVLDWILPNMQSDIIGFYEKDKSYLDSLIEKYEARVFAFKPGNSFSVSSAEELRELVKKYCNKVAEYFQIQKRGFIKKDYLADLVLLNLNKPNDPNSMRSFMGYPLSSLITHTWVNGQLVSKDRVVKLYQKGCGQKLIFDRT